MERATLTAMLDQAQGVQGSGDSYTIADGYRVSLYVGKPGQGMEVTEVTKIGLKEGFCEVTAKEHNAAHYLEYSNLHGVTVRPPSGASTRRAGFS